MKRISLALYAVAFGIILNSCNDPSPIGSELLSEDQVDVFYTDTISLTATTIKEDSLLTYDPNPSVIYDNFLLGDYNDPVFGNVIAGFYAQLTLDFDPPDYENATLDSIVLNLQYDSSGTYGVLNQDPFSLGVYRITEDVDKESEYFSKDFFQVDEAMPLAEVADFNPKLAMSDSIIGVIDYRFDSNGDTIDLPAGLRIKLPNSFGQELVDYNEDIYASNTAFLEQFRGIHVRPMTSTPGMLSFDISSLSASGMTVYYRLDTVKTQYDYEFSSRFVQFNNFKHDFTSAPVDDFFDDAEKGDSLLFIQAMSGPNIKIEVQNIEAFRDVIINKAELIFTVADPEGGDLNDFPPMDNIIAADIGDEGQFVFVSDVLAGGNNFGGSVMDEVGIDDESIQQYSMNISAHFQQIVEGTRDEIIYLRAFPKQELASRTVIYGPGHSKYPMKIKLTYTKLN